MQPAINIKTPKKPTNVTVDSSLLVEARSLNINLSATLEKALINEVRQAKALQWRADNKNAINHCNELADKNGLFSDKHRAF